MTTAEASLVVATSSVVLAPGSVQYVQRLAGDRMLEWFSLVKSPWKFMRVDGLSTLA